MTINNELAEKLPAIWKKVKEDYEKELINSERCLQAILYMYLRKTLSKDYKIYVEPDIGWHIKKEAPDSYKKVIPDIVVCRINGNKRKIKCIIEIKYAPHINEISLNDANKLDIIYNKYKNEECKIFIYGPDKRSTPDLPAKWNNEHLRSYQADKDTMFLFVLIAPEEKFNSDLIKQFLNKKNNYMLAAKTFSDKPIKFSNDLKLCK